jgi:hypothetical protein
MTPVLTPERRTALLARSSADDVVEPAKQIVGPADEIEQRCRRTDGELATTDHMESARLAPTALSSEVPD